jgi:hypothetical protein
VGPPGGEGYTNPEGPLPPGCPGSRLQLRARACSDSRTVEVPFACMCSYCLRAHLCAHTFIIFKELFTYARGLRGKLCTCINYQIILQVICCGVPAAKSTARSPACKRVCACVAVTVLERNGYYTVSESSSPHKFVLLQRINTGQHLLANAHLHPRLSIYISDSTSIAPVCGFMTPCTLT